MVPTEMRVSIVAVPWRRLVQAARWNGNAPQTTTGAARVSESHCQWSNCRAGTIESNRTGMVKAVEMARRSRRRRVGSSRSSPPSPAVSVAVAGRWAVYPAASTSATNSAGSIPSGNVTWAFSVA